MKFSAKNENTFPFEFYCKILFLTIENSTKFHSYINHIFKLEKTFARNVGKEPSWNFKKQVAPTTHGFHFPKEKLIRRATFAL